MSQHDDILISLKPKYANEIFDGTKTVELRKRRPNVSASARIWIYVTVPTAAIRGYADLANIRSGTPDYIWRSLGSRAAISKEEFDTYFAARTVAHALVLTNVMEMEQPLELERIRELVGDFHPPQFFRHLNGAKTVMRLNSRKYRSVHKS